MPQYIVEFFDVVDDERRETTVTAPSRPMAADMIAEDPTVREVTDVRRIAGGDGPLALRKMLAL